MSDLTYDLLRADRDRWKKRAESAEAVAKHALWISPLTHPKQETAAELVARFRCFVERHHPDVIIRYEHTRIEVLKLAEGCGCDPDADGYDGDHCEFDEDGEPLCSRSHLGYICDTCVNEEGDGPTWLPDRHEWPCPPVSDLEQHAATEGGAA